MDFIHIVNTKSEYSPENLKPYDKGFADGIKYVEEKFIDTFLYNVTDDEDTLRGKLEAEYLKECLDELKKWLAAEAAEFTVCTIDNYEEEKE